MCITCCDFVRIIYIDVHICTNLKVYIYIF